MWKIVYYFNDPEKGIRVEEDFPQTKQELEELKERASLNPAIIGYEVNDLIAEE